MNFHEYVHDLLDSMPDPHTLVTVQTTSSSTSTSQVSNEKSLFKDYFNTNDGNEHYDEFEAYIATKVPNVSAK